MNYYVPSYRKSSNISFKRRRSRKPLLFAALLLILAVSLLMSGFGPKGSDRQQNSAQKPDVPVTGGLSNPKSSESYVNAPEKAAADETLSASSAEALLLEKTQSHEPGLSLEERTITVSSGDTLMAILVREGLARSEAHALITRLQEVFNPRRIRQGHELTLAFETLADHDPVFHNLNLKLGVTRSVEVARCSENGLVARELTRELGSRPVRAEAEISSSLYNAAVNAGMPVEVLMQMIRAYSFDVDFQRDIRPGDSFQVLFEEQIDDNGQFVRGGSVLYASLSTRGRNLPIYRYQTSDGEVDFFNDRGQSVRKTLMVTPIDGARLTSGYGKRRHPILGYSRMHQGLDFAAPTGTPIMAAGDGVVEFAGRKGNYGNYIRLRHPNEYHTVYAHMSRFASGIRQGARVKQGETIGYVGSTGMSTGPHLHYEVHYRGRHVNPATVDTPPGRTLKGDELERFMSARKDLETLFASLEKRDKLARLE